MTKIPIADIKAMPEYQELLRRRRRVGWLLTAIILTAYFSFILMVGYTPHLLAIRLGDGITSVGILAGLGLILLTIGMTAYYVWYANRYLEDLVATIHDRGL